MKMKKYLAGAFTALALAVSAGCQMFHAADVETKAKKSVDPRTALYRFELEGYTVKLKDPAAKDVDWQKLSRDAAKLDPKNDVTPRGASSFQNVATLNRSVTSDQLQKLLSMQGEVITKDKSTSVLYVLNGESSTIQTSYSKAFLPAKQCQPDRVSPGIATFVRTTSVSPSMLGNGGLMLSYKFDFDPKIEVPECNNSESKTTLPGGGSYMTSSVTYVPPETDLAVSGLREQHQDSNTLGYANAPENQVIVMVIRPIIVN